MPGLPAALLAGRRVIVVGDGIRSFLVVGAYGSTMFNVANGLVQLDAAGHVPYAQLSNADSAGHYATVAGTPTIAAGAGAGTGPTINLSGTDEAGSILVTTGSAPSANAIIVTVTFANAFPGAVRSVIVTPGNANAAALGGLQPFVIGAGANMPDATRWNLQSQSGAALAASTSYRWWYDVRR